jgi:glucosyl-3-phosphoglycerate synthase
MNGLVHEVVVVDDQSTDGTAHRAAAAGADVVASRGDHGKGQALRHALDATTSEHLVFLDADVVDVSPSFIASLLEPLHDPAVQLVKPTYRRSLHGRADEGGRVTELLARPLLRRFFPEVAARVRQPLAGECAVRRAALDDIELDRGYGIEIGLLLDIYERFGIDAITEIDLGDRTHRNRPLAELARCADDVLVAVLARLDPINLITGGTS